MDDARSVTGVFLRGGNTASLPAYEEPGPCSFCQRFPMRLRRFASQTLSVRGEVDRSDRGDRDHAILRSAPDHLSDSRPRDRSVSAASPRGLGSWSVLTGALVVFALLSACQKIWDTDIFWHLTEGEWGFAHRTLQRIDHWSVSGPAHPIVAIYTLYHLVITPLHSVAGFAGLSILNMLLFAGIAITLARAIPAHARGAVAALCLVAALFVIQSRMRMRPETFTFLFLAITVNLLEKVRRGELPASRLLWLAPLIAAWANMHSLFAVGLATIWMAVVGRWIDARRPPREWIRAAVIATLACLINPTPLQLIRLPISYFSQVNARVSTYALGFAEFLPSWKESWAPEVIAVLVILLLAVVGMMIKWRERTREIPVAHLLWLVAFAYLGATAFRNLALAALVGGYLAACHVGALIPARQRWAVWSASAAAVLFGLLFITGVIGVALHRAGRPGVGLQDDFFPLRIAEKIASSNAPGDILPIDFGDGGPLIYAANRARTDPTQIIHRVYIDGRSDLHPQERYMEVFRIESEIASSPEAAGRVTLPSSVRFLVVNFNNLEALRSLGASRRFRLYCLDRNHACFVRADDPDFSPFKVDWSEYDVPLSVDPPGALLGRAGPYRRTWFRRHPLDTHWRLGTVLAFLGRDDLAARYLECAEMLDSGPRAEREGMLAMVLARLVETDAAKGDLRRPNLPGDVDPRLVRALFLLQRTGVCSPRTEEGRTHAIQRILLLNQVGARDRAAEETDRLVDSRGGASDPDLVSLRQETHAGLAAADSFVDRFITSRPALDPLMRATVFSSAGLSRRAIALLAHERRPLALVQRGDILLRMGDVANSRRLYMEAGNVLNVQERLAICAWARGDLKGASAMLDASGGQRGDLPARRALPTMLDAYLGIENRTNGRP